MSCKKIGLLGGRGYVGQEIISLLNNNNDLSIGSVYSSSKAGQPVSMDESGEIIYQDLALDKIDLGDEEAFILALPNKKSQQYVDLITNHNKEAIIVDLSSDHRFDKNWEYRIPELSDPVSLKKISNPGCYASAMQFMIAPILNILDGPVNLFGISGYSGAGASPNQRNNTELLKDNILPYTLVKHLHEKEVQTHSYPDILFTPHVGNFFRGIMITGNFFVSKQSDPREIMNLFTDFYREMSLIFIQESPPNLQEVQNTSNVIIGGFEMDKATNRLTFCCALDNLLKGAATQAVQNLNSAFGWDDNAGII